MCIGGNISITSIKEKFFFFSKKIFFRQLNINLAKYKTMNYRELKVKFKVAIINFIMRNQEVIKTFKS